jgi:DNA primase
MLQEIKEAAQQRLESVRTPQPAAITEVERILLCALVKPEGDAARTLVVDHLGIHPEWYGDMPSATVMEVLVNAPAPGNPFDAAPDEASRTQLASALHTAAEHDTNPDAFLLKLQGALATLADRYADRRLSELTRQIGEAERRGDDAMRLTLMQELMRLNRERKR